MSGPFHAPVLIPHLIEQHARWHASKAAWVSEDRTISWAAFAAGVNGVANGLIRLGIARGDRVAFLLDNSLTTAETLFGIAAAGAVAVPLSTMLPPGPLDLMIQDCGARALLTNARTKALIAAPLGILALDADDPAWRGEDAPPNVHLTGEDDFNIIYSSGTTGVPKGIVHTHAARAAVSVLRAAEYRVTGESVALLTTPLYSNGTWTTMLPAIAAAATIVVMPRFDPLQFLELAEKHRATHTFLVPTQCRAVMEQAAFDRFDLSSLYAIISTGAPTPGEMKLRIARRFQCEFIDLYGLTEGIACLLRPEDRNRKPDSVGKPAIGADIRIIDEAGQELPVGEVGEIVGRTPFLMRGYHNRPDLTAEATWTDVSGRAWFRTGDIGRLDADGFLYLLDRKKDMIISGGINVYPADIEAILLRHPAIEDAAVVGVRDAKWGETPVAVVVLKRGTAAPVDLLEWLNPQLAKYQRVSRIEFREALPRNPLGKVLKRELRSLLN